jgi:hypothetical protein
MLGWINEQNGREVRLIDELQNRPFYEQLRPVNRPAEADQGFLFFLS